MKTPSRHVALDRKIEAELKVVAAETDRSVSYVVREAVRAYLATRRKSSVRHDREAITA
jgi:predicted transcriptional regulator